MKAKVRKCYWCKYAGNTGTMSRLKFMNRKVYVHTDTCLRPAKCALKVISLFQRRASAEMLRALNKFRELTRFVS